MKAHHAKNRLLAPALALLALSTAPLQADVGLRQTNLVSDIPGMATTTDPNLVNPWGVSLSPKSPFWISNAGTGTSTLYNGAGGKIPLTVTIPGPVSPSTPTGQVFNGTGQFNNDSFIFATADGTIAGWRGALGTNAETLSDHTADQSVFLGLAIGSTSGGSYLYASDFRNNKIVVTPGGGAPALTGNFTDPNLPSGYSPFNITNLNGSLYIAYAKQEADDPGEEVHGAGLGFVDHYSLNGDFLGRVASNGPLNSPWGMVIAPSTMGSLAGDLLVGNFGDGTIHAYNLTSGDLVTTLKDGSGHQLVIDGLWGLTTGNGAAGGRTGSVYFTAGINDETHGLFGRLSPVPEPPLTGLAAGIVLAGAAVYRWRRQRKGALAAAA